jgi:D-alanyl-lipoteichoic acid acyltransferase DltB (MBOAT superfamily)
MSYTIDIYRKKLSATKHFLDFALYVSFFPQLVAGPIERATRLLPQIQSERKITSTLFKASAFLFFYGLFEKVVVADNLAVLVDNVYNENPSNGFDVLIATYGFAFQIFADFDGYSNMAKGLAGLMGFQLMTNFKAPYFAESPSEFWNRWHISLSTWLRDYLYIPLGGNRLGKIITARNLIVTMLLGGLWHGASWMFLSWGAFHALLLVLYLPFKEDVGRLSKILKQLLFFHLVCFGWMLFRAQNFQELIGLLEQLIFNFHITLDADQLLIIKKLLLYITVPLLFQYWQFKSDKLCPIFDKPLYFRSAIYLVLFYYIVIFGFNNAQSFIYFQL